MIIKWFQRYLEFAIGTIIAFVIAFLAFILLNAFIPNQAPSQTAYGNLDQVNTLKEINKNLDRIADALENIDRKKQSSL